MRQRRHAQKSAGEFIHQRPSLDSEKGGSVVVTIGVVMQWGVAGIRMEGRLVPGMVVVVMSR